MRRETVSKSNYLGERAIVVGGGLAGLSAARALSDRFRQVVILDRDELPDSATPRPGVPQGKHPHALLGGGLKALEQLFPGFGNELGRAGAVPINRGFDMLYEIPGQDAWPRIKFGWPTYAMSRPLIELTLRRQVERLTNVKVQGRCRVLNIICSFTPPASPRRMLSRQFAPEACRESGKQLHDSVSSAARRYSMTED